MRIVYLSDFPFSIAFGGKEVQMLSYYEFINNNLSDSFVVSKIDFWDKNSLNGVDILHLFGYGNWFLDILTPLKSKNSTIKVVISPTFYYDKIFLMRIKGFISNYYKGLAFFHYKRLIFSLVDSIVVNSKAEEKQLVSLFGKSLEKKIQVVYNSLELHFFDKPLDPYCFLTKYNIKAGYLLTISFQDERKNSINLVKAFLNVYSKIKRPLVLIGSQRFQSKKLNDEFSELLKSNEDKIIKIDYINRETEIDYIKSAILHSQAHVLVSYVETPGLANLEALAFDKPILVGSCDPVLEYFRDQAEYCNPNSLESIEEGIIKVSSLEPDYSRSAFVKSRFTLDKAISKLTTVYSS